MPPLSSRTAPFKIVLGLLVGAALAGAVEPAPAAGQPKGGDTNTDPRFNPIVCWIAKVRDPDPTASPLETPQPTPRPLSCQNATNRRIDGRIVVNVRPFAPGVAGATVRLKCCETERAVTSGSDGRFEITSCALGPRAKCIPMSVEANGFEPWTGVVSFYDFDPITIQLHRNLPFTTCPGLPSRVPADVLAAAQREPWTVGGYAELRDPMRPEGPDNPRRLSLSLAMPGRAYHPLYNGLVFLAGCR